MRFKPDEIVSVLSEEIGNIRSAAEMREVGRVLEVGDGIARVYGLSGVMAGEMVEFRRTHTFGLAFNLEENSVGVIILGEYLEIAEGDEVRTTGQLLRVPCGEALLGRVVNPLGVPSTARGRSSRSIADPWNRMRPALPSGNPSIFRCRPASRPSTP